MISKRESRLHLAKGITSYPSIYGSISFIHLILKALCYDIIQDQQSKENLGDNNEKWSVYKSIFCFIDILSYVVEKM